mmetsp:Transcript_15441/g.31987  ORF Transcript_15441/g.31987 Transcript_15441/m.31987 type:complete len:80 (+) Transcript_15441:1238-1477(+)
MYVVLISIFSGARSTKSIPTVENNRRLNRTKMKHDSISSRDRVKRACGQKTSMNVTKQDSTVGQSCMWTQFEQTENYGT